VPVMQVLALWGLIRSIGATTGPIFYSVGKPEIGTKLQFLQLIILIVSIYPLTILMGILGASFSVVIAGIIPNLGASYATVRITKCGIFNFCKVIIIPLISTLIAILFLMGLKIYWHFDMNFFKFFASIIFFLLIYLIGTFFIDKFSNYRLLPMIISLSKEMKI